MFRHLYSCINTFAIVCGLSLCFIAGSGKAQDFEFGRLTAQDSTIKTYSAGSAAGAVVLNEFGLLTFRKAYPYHLVHVYHTKIKILKSNAVDQADIKLPFYKWTNNVAEKISNFEAVVFTPGINGKFTKTVCPMSAGHITNQSKHVGIFAYALPNVSAGSIIEYRYELETTGRDDFKPWVFQKDLPKLHSEYWVHMPPKLNYDVILKGGYKLSKNYIDSTQCDDHGPQCSKQVYAMDSIAAFVAEDRMTDVVNYIPALYFYKVTLGFNTQTKRITSKDWSDFDMQAKTDMAFGYQLTQKDFFRRKLKDFIPANTDTLALAKSIYNYINKNIKWNKQLIPASLSVQKAFKDGKGTVGDINLMLIAALRAYGIKSDPVLISTKNNGPVDMYLPEIDNFDYVVAKTLIANKNYYLDATDALLPFGLLPEFCFNDYGRLISSTDSCYWLKMESSHSITNNYIVDISLNSNGSIKGTATGTFTGYGSYVKRKEIKNYNSTDEYLEKLKDTFNGIKVLNVTVEGIDSISSRLRKMYDIEVSRSANNTSNQIYFNPYLFDPLTENPFNLDNRLYPIDCGFPSEQRIVVTLHLPEHYDLELPPADMHFTLPNNGGYFLSSFHRVNDTAIFSHIIKFNRSVYEPEEYPYLKEFFNKIIQAQKADVILKRKI